MSSKLRRALPIVLGLLLLALFIWFAGPYFAFAEYQPLERPGQRLIAIALVCLGCAAVVLYKRFKAKRSSDKLAAAMVQQPAAAEPARPSAEAVQLRERFEEAVATLKDKQRNGHGLYDLPWYVIIGAPGSGKTTALVNSGLHFPLEQRSGRAALRGIGGTRNCDWWFTDEAVLLDTAGRYTTQDSDATSDSAGWREFLGLLRKYRKRRPVNGVILTLSAHDVMTQTPGAADPHVEAVRRRLIELNRELRVRVPVYLLVTKCDLVAGFAEYLDDLGQEGRAQVWGVTFPYEQTANGQAAAGFPVEFDALITRLNERVFARVEEDRDLSRRARLLAFPQQMAALRGVLTQFVSDVFAATRFDQQILLRGVYLTSGTQEGTPIDRLLGALGRRFAVAPEAMVTPGRGKAYFIDHVLHRVLFPESGLAGVNRRFEMQWAATQVGLYAAMAGVALLGLVLWTVSYSRNRAYIDQVAADVATLAAVPPVAAASSLDDALPRLDAVRAVVDSAERPNADTPLAMRWGLYQGSWLADAASDAYGRELHGAMLPHVAARFRQRLIEHAAEPEKLYEYLKGYLMLGYPEHLDKEQLAYLAGLEWEAAYAGNPDRALSVGRHFTSLLERTDAIRAIPLDETIIAQARSTLRQASPPGLVYRYVKIEYAGDTARALRLDLAAGLGAERVLRRKSRVPLSEPMSSLYTKPVFEELTSATGTANIVKRFIDERWVWGEDGLPIGSVATLPADVLELYESDYIAAWDRVVDDIQAAPLASLAATKEAVAILAGSTSPLRGLLQVVVDHTYLVKPADPAKPGVLGSVGSGVRNALEAGRRKLGMQTAVPGVRITAHFEPVRRLLEGGPGGAPIDGVLQKLRQLEERLQPIGNEVGSSNPGDPASINAVGQAASEVKRDAAPLPSGFATVVSDVANSATAAVRGGVRVSLQNRFEQDVLKECSAVTSSRYPFVPTSTMDVPLADFGRLFGHGGIYDTFFKNELAPLVDTSRSQWVWRNDGSGASVGGSVAMLRQFEAAERIRAMFFRSGSSDPDVRFTLETVELDDNALRFTLDLDGQEVVYRHGPTPAKPVTWPGPKPGAVTVTFEGKDGSRPSIAAVGPWAWFRVIDAGRLERESESSYELILEKGGHRARVQLEAASIRNPYGQQVLRQFRCP